MPSRIFDNPLSRRIAASLEWKHNHRLGIRNTMRLARAYNRLKNLRYWKFRQGLYRQDLAALLAENGRVRNPALKIEDGWALDSSKSLPHLNRLLAASQEIIQQRSGVKRGGGDRAFFQQIMTDENVRRFPAILDFATSNEVLQTVIDYLGFLPTLSVSQPLGVRLAESDARLAEPKCDGYCESQLFHCDYHDSPMVYMIVALQDVTLRSGPFSFLPANASRRAARALCYGRRGSPYRIGDKAMYSVVSRNELNEMICPAGTVLFIDSSCCFHYGSRDAVIPRYLMMYAYVSVCRTDFGDLLRKESPTLVIDDSSRTRRAKYSVGRHDSRLRRLVLDCEFLERIPADPSAEERGENSRKWNEEPHVEHKTLCKEAIS